MSFTGDVCVCCGRSTSVDKDINEACTRTHTPVKETKITYGENGTELVSIKVDDTNKKKRE